MIEIPKKLKKIHEAQAPSITDETLSNHHMNVYEEKEKELSRVGVVLKSPRRLRLLLLLLLLFFYYYYYYFKHQPNRDSEKEEIGGLA